MRAGGAEEEETHGLELVQVDIERSVETERGGDARNDLGNDPVKVLESGRLDSEVLAADVVDRLVVNEEGAVDVLERSVGREDRVVGLERWGQVRSQARRKSKATLTSTTDELRLGAG
jgi:hypothetical protein